MISMVLTPPRVVQPEPLLPHCLLAVNVYSLPFRAHLSSASPGIPDRTRSAAYFLLSPLRTYHKAKHIVYCIIMLRQLYWGLICMWYNSPVYRSMFWWTHTGVETPLHSGYRIFLPPQKVVSCPLESIPSLPHAPGTTDLISATIVLPFTECHRNGIYSMRPFVSGFFHFAVV